MKPDILTPVRPEKDLHPQFRNLRDSSHFEPARQMVRKTWAEMDDPDGNFIEQFQTTAFDSRTFELFLYEMFKECGHKIDRWRPNPDFMLSKGGTLAAVEAVTVNPTGAAGAITPYDHDPIPLRGQALEDFFKHEVPIRFGGPLYSKLQKKYWEKEHIKGKPLIFAIEAFHAPGALGLSSSSLSNYLFGVSQSWYRDERGKLVIETQRVKEHTIPSKKKLIPSGFFNQPGVENVSAVLFVNSGTIAKFNRMGLQAKMGKGTVRMIRYGTCYDWNPNAAHPHQFLWEVGSPAAVPETWWEGTSLIRNPNALYKLPDEWLGAASEDDLIDGKPVPLFREWGLFHPYRSRTETFDPDASGTQPLA